MSEYMRAYGTHRMWSIVPRVGTRPGDKWTILASPVPGGDNPASAYEDGQYPDRQAALCAIGQAERVDDGTSEEDRAMGDAELDVLLDDMRDAAREMLSDVETMRTLHDEGANPVNYASRVRRSAEGIAEAAETVRRWARGQ